MLGTATNGGRPSGQSRHKTPVLSSKTEVEASMWNTKYGKFRSCLLVRLKGFLSDERDRANALRRGGGRKSNTTA